MGGGIISGLQSVERGWGPVYTLVLRPGKGEALLPYAKLNAIIYTI